MDLIETAKKIGKKLCDIYLGIGAAVLGVLTVSVIFAVIARYCFSLSWKQLSEFNITCFCFTTFWGMGVCVLKDEHVMIDILYDGLKPMIKRILSIINYVILLIVDLVFTWYSYLYTLKMGIQISQGMEIPMYLMYGIMPVSGLICALCVIYRIYIFATAPVEYFAPKNAVVKATGEDK